MKSLFGFLSFCDPFGFSFIDGNFWCSVPFTPSKRFFMNDLESRNLLESLSRFFMSFSHFRRLSWFHLWAPRLVVVFCFARQKNQHIGVQPKPDSDYVTKLCSDEFLAEFRALLLNSFILLLVRLEGGQATKGMRTSFINKALVDIKAFTNVDVIM